MQLIRFDSKRIVSGAYDGKIKVWDLQAAMDPRYDTVFLVSRRIASEYMFEYASMQAAMDPRFDLAS